MMIGLLSVLLVCFGLLVFAGWYVWRLRQQFAAELTTLRSYDPFNLDLARLTANLTVKRANGSLPPIQVSLLQLMDVMNKPGATAQSMAEELTALCYAQDAEHPLTENEVRLIMLYAMPSLTDFATALKKALPFG